MPDLSGFAPENYGILYPEIKNSTVPGRVGFWRGFFFLLVIVAFVCGR